MQLEKTEAIVLKSIQYKEKSRIITVFSKEYGLLSLIANKRKNGEALFFAITTPFCESELIFKRNNELCFLEEGTVLEINSALRKDLQFIESACFLSRTILESQLPNKREKNLYELFKSFLKKISSFSNLPTLKASFYLKLLTHEGSFNVSAAKNFTNMEKDLLTDLVSVRNFENLKKIDISEELFKKIKNSFEL